MIRVRHLPPRPDLAQLKRQAKELLAAYVAGEPDASAEVQAHYPGADLPRLALHDAQLVLARGYGFDSWPRLKAFVGEASGRTGIKPRELDSPDGDDTWQTILAASTGDVVTLRRLLARDRRLARATYWYTPAIHFAVRDGHVDAVRLLLEGGADPEHSGLHEGLIQMARDRGREEIAQLLERARDGRGRVVPQPTNHAIHKAAALGQLDDTRAMLDADPSLVNLGGREGMTPLHHAVLGGRREMITMLLERGANIHARSSRDFEAIDLALWNKRRGLDAEIARLLLSRGATCDLTTATALGDLAAVRQMLDSDPSRIHETRPSGRRPLSAAVEFEHDDIVRLLLERGVDPRWDEPDAPHGTSVHAAAIRGNLAVMTLLLEHGADPNEDIDSTSPPVTFAATLEIKALLESHGGGVGIYDTSWVEHDDEMLRRLAAAPEQHAHHIGVSFVMSAHRPELLARLLDAGLRMPSVHTSCQGYLVKPDALRLLLAHGMSPDQMNWQHQTLLHWASLHDTPECARILLDAGATMTARDDEYRSTPLAWAARADKPRIVEFLLSRGAPVSLPDDEPWATPLAWAERRGHEEVASMLRMHGATASR